MEITVMAFPAADDPAGVGGLLSQIDSAAAAGFRRAWVPQLPPAPGTASWDTLTVLGIAGAQTPDIELASGVVVAHTQHPLTLARQALTVSAVVSGRLTLGIGVGHRFMVTDMFGYSYDAPAAYLREYLEVLGPALAGEPVEHHGPRITAVGQVDLPTAPAPPLVIAALGPRMLDLAGELTDGTVATWTGPRVLEERIVPRISKAATDFGRPAPQIVVGVPVMVTDDTESARATVLNEMGQAGEFPAYRAILEAEGVDTIADVCLIGDEEHVASRLRRFADIGATEFVASPHGDAATRSRTVALMQSLSTDAVLRSA
jgi:F420-dependent oxidoreductase-like protein